MLFVDIRGYTGFSEARQAEEIFRTVNRYTETVSQLVRARGGTVVEFHGDGLLAVFGAPDALAMKERAAVQVGCEIVAAIATPPTPAAINHQTLSVGVGISTGPAFVGNIQSSDRFIWTVIGDTVNLAARLQSLTRELDAAVAIDDTTFRRAGRGDLRGVRAPCGCSHSRPRPARDRARLAAATGTPLSPCQQIATICSGVNLLVRIVPSPSRRRLGNRFHVAGEATKAYAWGDWND